MAASKTIILLLITNFIIAHTQDLTSEEIKTVKESEELPEDSTVPIEEEFSTTTEYNVTDEDVDPKNAEQDTIETATDETSLDITGSNANNVVDDTEKTIQSNLSNNIDIVSKVNKTIYA